MELPSRYVHDAGMAGGGMGDILFCRDLHLNRKVVVKMLKAGGDEKRLRDEQIALTKIRSKHVVQLYDIIKVVQDKKTADALVLEYINGADLRMESYAPDQTYLKVLWQIACGLAEIHRHSIIHRDIKPQNIRKDTDGIIKILDFGLARSEGIDAQTKNVIGTMGYMAPELWRTSDISFDQAIDVYAFGVMALTLLTTDVPAALIDRPPKPLPANSLDGKFVGLPPDVVKMIERCVQYDPKMRPSMEEVEDILRRYLLTGQHRGLIVLGNNHHEITNDAPHAVANAGEKGSLGIAYDGLCFRVSSLSGDVAVNNRTLNVGDELPFCCVIAFGVGTKRNFATLDVSNPEVMP